MERGVGPFNHGRVLHSPSEVKESPKPASTWPASPAWTSRCPCHLPDPPAPPPDQLATQWTQIRWSPSPELKSLMVPHVIQSKSESLPACPTLNTCRLRLVPLKPRPAPSYPRAFARAVPLLGTPFLTPSRPRLTSPLIRWTRADGGTQRPLWPLSALVQFQLAPDRPSPDTFVVSMLPLWPYAPCFLLHSDVPPREHGCHSWSRGTGIEWEEARDAGNTLQHTGQGVT